LKFNPGNAGPQNRRETVVGILGTLASGKRWRKKVSGTFFQKIKKRPKNDGFRKKVPDTFFD
jgi:hypothetical protein